MKITRYPLASHSSSQPFLPADFLADPDGFSADSVTAFEQLVEAAGFSPDVSDVRVGALAAPFGEHLAGSAVVCRLDEDRMVGRYFAVVDLLSPAAVGDWQAHAVAPPCVAANSVHHDAVPANAVPANAVPANAVPANAVPANAVPANAVPANAVPANVTQLAPYPVRAA